MSYFPVLIFLLFATCSSLGSDVEQDPTDPKWKAMLANFYQSGQITTNPADIHVTHVVLHHEHIWLLGNIDSFMMTLEVNGGSPCLLATNGIAIIIDACGISVKSTTNA